MYYSDKHKIGVFGSADSGESSLRQAKIIGSEIAKRNGILITGACGGIPQEAAFGAHDQGGLVIGISPAMNLTEHTEKYGFPALPYLLIFTGLGRTGRNVISCRACDAAIFICGRVGTVNEFINLYSEADSSKVIGLLKGSGGAVDDVISSFIRQDQKKSQATIVGEEDPVNLVDLVFKHLILKKTGVFMADGR